MLHFSYTLFLLNLQSGTCSLREAVIIGSILEKCSIPMLHSWYVIFCINGPSSKIFRLLSLTCFALTTVLLCWTWLRWSTVEQPGKKLVLLLLDFFNRIVLRDLLLCSYFIKTLLEKKYCMPYRVLDALVAHFMRFVDEIRVMPVIWHQSLLTFVQR